MKQNRILIMDEIKVSFCLGFQLGGEEQKGITVIRVSIGRRRTKMDLRWEARGVDEGGVVGNLWEYEKDHVSPFLLICKINFLIF